MLPRIDAETNSQEDFYLATPEYIYIIFYDYYKVFICIIYIFMIIFVSFHLVLKLRRQRKQICNHIHMSGNPRTKVILTRDRSLYYSFKN